MAQPAVTLRSLDDADVYLLGFGDFGFSQALDAQRDRALDVLLPYTPVILNGASKDVIAYTVRWICTEASGKVRTPSVTIFDFSSFPSSANLPPQAQRAVSHLPGFGGRQLRYSDVRQDAEGLVASFRKCQSITVSLDAVLFGDGTAVGPDPQHWIDRWKARIDAERDTYTEMSESSPFAMRAMLAAFVAAGKNRATTLGVGEPTNIGSVLNAANHARTYEDSYVLMKGFFAMYLENRVDKTGEAAAIADCARVIASKEYPQIHRKGY